MDAKFGIFIHWGVYSVPAIGSEWYPKHMYNGLQKEHRRRFGNQRDFGYKDFIPLFKAEKFSADQWAELFREAGARYVIPTAEHHDGFAMYDSKLTRWNAKRMGPRRDVIGELCKATRRLGMRFGISNHRVENWDFMYPSMPEDSTDLLLPEYAGLYGPQRPTGQSAMGPVSKGQELGEASLSDIAKAEGHHPQSDAFLNEWQWCMMEIIDKYHPDLIYFDNGVNYRSMDLWKLRIARYYYNSAWHWKKEVSLQTKSQAYLAGSIRDFERESRAPRELTSYYWQVDDPIGNKFGYVEGLTLQQPEGIIRNLVDNISHNGNLCLNVSPKSDGTIPEDQQRVLLRIGRWLARYGDGVYGSRAWTTAQEGDMRFTCKGDTVYVFVMGRHREKTFSQKPFTVRSLAGLQVTGVTDMGRQEAVSFTEGTDGLFIQARETEVDDPVVCFRVCTRGKE